MKVPMQSQKVQKRTGQFPVVRVRTPAPFRPDFSTVSRNLAILDQNLKESLETSPFLGLPFGLAVLAFILLLGLLSPLVTPARDFSLPGGTLPFPNDSKLPTLLFHDDALDAILAEAPAETSLQDTLQKDKTKVLETQAYTMQRGDGLSAIANKFNVSLGTLISFNNIKNVRKVGLGTQLVIPNSDGVLYTVATGDSLSGIARANKVDYERILEANKLTSPVVSPGQKIFLPGATLSTWDLKQASGELFIYPVRGYITSRFGTRRDPFTGVKTFHNGIDLANALGTPVRASMAGTVTDTGFNSSYGNYIVISHEGGFQTLYGHLKAIQVKIGQNVGQAQQIGLMGSTGYSTGSHTHFSIFKWNKPLNPLNYLY
ncbi:MAG TPA: M23 family metallopeptidase [Spirochaetia bacterium]|jgi:murein DD-endopeptidase MepM/ murein hydrolase activator NlpD|nr:M23 family metallopeptidase [Spirochaetia bacterium]